MLPPPTSERRRFERVRLHLPLQFKTVDHPDMIVCITENISSEGVYFTSLFAAKVGERLDVDMLLPAHNSGRSEVRVHLKCRAQVVRVDSSGERRGFGIACRIEKHSIWFEETI